jgi:8-oxo-dGTP pyrophosphatase MutT (NUDIX family)
VSLLARVREANRHRLDRFLVLRVAGEAVGHVRPAFAEHLARWPEVFDVRENAVRLARALDAPATPAARRSEAVAEVCRALHREGAIPGWRDECYPVARAFGAPPLLLLERAAVPFFGVTAYGVHMNGLVRRRGRLQMWLGRRSLSKPTGPGKLDQLVAGGQPHGMGLKENLIKECWEEAGIPAALAARARPVGAISYVMETEQGLRPDVLFNFDLDLPEEFEPVNHDGEVEAFYLWDLERVEHTAAGSDDFKLNCALVVIDFLIRYGRIPADHPDYQALVLGLRPDPGQLDASAGGAAAGARSVY